LYPFALMDMEHLVVGLLVPSYL